MSKLDKLEILMLLSSLETWTFATKERLPDHLADRIGTVVEKLTHEILDEENQ